MKIETQPLDNHQLKVVVEVNPDEYEQSRQTAIRKLTQKVKIPGFRPGKAPTQIALKHLDPQLVVEETLETFVDNYYPKILEEAKIEPYGPGILEAIRNVEPPVMEFVVPLKPTVELGDYRSIRVPYEYENITQEDIDSTIKDLRVQLAVIEPVERPIQEDDIVYLDIKGEKIDEDGTSHETITSLSQYPIIIQSEQPIEWPFPGFSKQLIGKNKEDSFDIEYTYPADFQNETLRGSHVRFQGVIHDIKHRVLPELNDEFAQSVGNYSNLDELIQAVRDSLEHQKQDEYHEEYDDLVLDQIINISSIHYPPQMVEKEKKNILEQLKDRLARVNMDIELYLKTRKISQEELDKEIEQNAERNIRRTLVLFEVADKENIKVDPNQLQNNTQQAVDDMIRLLPENKRTKLAEKQIASTIIENVMMNLLIESTLSRLRQIAKGELTSTTDVQQTDPVTPETVEEESNPDDTIAEN